MPDLLDKLERIRGDMSHPWDELHTAAALATVHRRLWRRRAARRTLVAVSILGAMALAPLVVERLGGRGTIRFPDGSLAWPKDAASVIEARQVSAEAITVVIHSGGGRFEVPLAPARDFAVETGGVTILSRGAKFLAQRDGMGAQVDVEVELGEVEVTWKEGAERLVSGERGRYPPPHMTSPSPPASKGGAPARVEVPASPHSGWRQFAQEGRFAEAWQVMQATAVRDEPADLMLAADVARLSGHPEDAVGHLERLIERYRDDPRVQLAAFTLGRVLLGQLGEPRRAAEAFALARAFAPEGSLAEDALAREVEAWWSAGAQDEARARAELYLRLFPDGNRVRAVRVYGGLTE